MESKLQSNIIKWLKSKGAYVIKTKPGPGVPVGCPDILALYEGAWLALECKAAEKAKWQPGQQATLERLSEWSPFVYKVYPENWIDIQNILLTHFF